MDNTRRVVKAKQEQERHQLLSPSSSGTRSRRSSPTNSPEFEFWMVRNPNFPQPNLLSADQLFSDGVLLPLHLLQPNNNNHQSEPPGPCSSLPDPSPEISPTSSVTAAGEPTSSTTITASLTSSKRWTDIIFKKNEKKANNKNQEEDRDREKETKEKEEKIIKREKKGVQSRGSSSAELNIINIWPFSRSRSAGNNNGGSRPRMLFRSGTGRKASSAPCSRSNSAGESKSRKWPSSPGRPGLHLGRSSPVWQVRRTSSSGPTTSVISGSGSGSGCSVKKSNNNVCHDRLMLVDQSGEKGASKKEVTVPRRGKNNSSGGSGSNNNDNDGGGGGGGGPSNSKAKVLNLKVPTVCIGYRNHLGCRSDENGGIIGAAATVAVGGSKNSRVVNIGKGSNPNIYNLGNGGNANVFNFFTKKVY